MLASKPKATRRSSAPTKTEFDAEGRNSHVHRLRDPCRDSRSSSKLKSDGPHRGRKRCVPCRIASGGVAVDDWSAEASRKMRYGVTMFDFSHWVAIGQSA